MARAPAYRDAAGRFTARDGLANLASGAGTSADKRTFGFYTRPYILPEQIEASYRSSWLMRKLVDLPPFDMTRAGRDWQLGEDEVGKIEREEARLGVWAKLRQALVLGRLGGGLIILGIGGDPTQPITESDKAEGRLAYLHVMNRWQVSLGQVITDPADPLFGNPSYYEIRWGKLGAAGSVKIHPSRVVPFRGKPVPNIVSAGSDDWFWGDPEMVSVEAAVKNADAAQNGFASLIEEAKVDTVSIPGLTQLVATAEGEALLLKRVTIANQLKSSHNTRILDGGRNKDQPGEEWDTRQVSWAGMPEMMKTYLSIVAGAADIPATRLLGKAPDGMNATGDGDMQNYVQMIRAKQEAELRPALDQLDAVLLPSAGVTIDDEAWYEFAPLIEASELERATIFKTRVDAIVALQGTNLIPDEALSRAVQHTATEEQWLAGLDGALAMMPEDERFPSLSEPDEADLPDDPSELQAGNDNPAAVPRRRAANDARFTDAVPRTLYVQRKLLNAAEFIRWAKGQGFTTTTSADELHVTIAFSRQPLDWMKVGQDWSSDRDGTLVVKAGGPRIVQALGDKGAVVLLFASDDLNWRHQAIQDAGASFDFDEYQPHVTITYAAPAGLDLAKVQPYTGPLKFGPELFSEVVEDWEKGVTEK